MICSICKSPVKPEETVKKCEFCNNEFHSDCWSENQGCGTPGCLNLPKKENIDPEGLTEATPWAAEKKGCPVCAELIPVNAQECPYCHQNFSTSSPLTAEDIRKRECLSREKLMITRGAYFIFAGGLLGVTAPLTLVVGGYWFSLKRKELREKTPAHYFLTITGLTLSVIYSIAILFQLFQGCS